MRWAMSPVPPAMSRMFRGCGSGEDEVVDVRSGFMPGSRERTKWSFQSRWIPRDIRSFIVS